MRLDFNSCNLSCVLCWSDNNAQDKSINVDDLMADFIHCITRKKEYLENHYPEGVREEANFNTTGLQLVGGEPLLSNERFQFILSFLEKINDYIETHTESSRYLHFNSKGQFKIKLFTNAVTIGEGVIKETDLMALDNLKNLDIRLLLSLKGLNRSEASQLQAVKNQDDILNSQVKALEMILSLPLKNIILEPVLGFYHSADFNIKTPDIEACNMFQFDVEDSISMELRRLLKKHVDRKGKIFVEPVHSVPQSENGRREFYTKFSDYLEVNPLIEPLLRGGSRNSIKKTKISPNFYT